MSYDDLRVPEPIEWLIYASVQHARTQIEAAAESVGVQIGGSYIGPAPVTEFNLQVVYSSLASPTQVAHCVIRGVSEQSCTVNMYPAMVTDKGPNMAAMIVRDYATLAESVSQRFKRIGVEYDDMSAPDFSGPRPRLGASTAIAKPSERSMWAAPVFYERVFRKRDDLCFVIMPFRPELLQFVEHAVKPVVTDLGFECKLANEIRGGYNDIVEEIWVALNEARFLIVDLTGQNPNVYYELGIANTLGKQIIAIHKKVADEDEVRLPFDVRTRRTVFYEDTMAGGAAFQKELREHIEAILQSQA
jgi:hypothetical protein